MGRRPPPQRARTPWSVLVLLALVLLTGVGGALGVALGTFDAGGEAGGAAAAGISPLGGATEDASGAAAAGATGSGRPSKAAAAAHVAGFASLRGQVRLFATREPVAGLALAMKPPEGAPVGATTDESGNFAFAQVPAGAGWELRGERAGYAPIELTGLDLAPDQAVDVGVLWLAVPVDLPALVVDATGRPVEGAEVAAFATGRTLPEEQDEWSADLREQRTLALVATPRPSRTAKTDAQGRATVTGLMPGAYRAVASAKDLAPASRSNLLLVPDAKPEPVRFVLGPAHALEGTVVDEAGKPVEKARVIAALRQGWLPTLDKSAAETGDAGTYRLEGLAAGGYFVYVLREGRPLLQVGTVAVPETKRFDIRLRPGGTIQGRVTDEDGKPVEGAEVHASMQQTWSPMATRTGKDGAFVLRDLPAGPLGYFRVDATGFIPFPDPMARQQGAGESLREGQTMVRDVTLRRGRTAAFTVVGEGKGPLEGVEVRLHLAAMWSGDVAPWKGVTDAKGRAVVSGLLPGEHLVVVAAEGWVQPGLPRDWRNVLSAPTAFPADWRVTIPPEGAVERDLRLTRGTAVSGRVFGPSGVPAGGASVAIDGVRREFPVFSAADGTFTIDTVPALRRAIVKAVAPDGAAGESEPFAVKAGAASEDVEVRLKEPGRVTGVVRSRSGRLPPGTVVRWLPGEVGPGDEWGWRRVDAAERHPVSPEGAFEIRAAAAGKITVRADAEGALPATQIVSVVPGVETGGVVLLLDTPRTLRGRAQSPQGTAVAGASVQARFGGRPSGGEPFLAGFGGMPTAQSDADGRFALEGLAEGRWEVWATAPGYAGAAWASTSTEAGEVLLTFAAAKSVTGVVKDPEGRPLAGIPVMAQRADGNQRGNWGWWGRNAYTAPDGTFELQDLAEGNYSLRVSGAWQWGREVNVEDTVKDGVAAGDQGVEIVVKPGLVIEGRLVDREKRPIRVGWISAQYKFDGNQQYQWGTERWIQVKPDGSFRIPGLRPGPYDLWAYGSFKQKQQAAVAAGTKDLEIQVEDAWAIAGVVVDEKGLSVREFGVQLRAEGKKDWDWPDYVTPGDGEFVVTGLDQTRYEVRVSVDGFAPTVVADVPAGRRDLEVRIVKGLEIAGVVVDAGGRPVGGASVSANATRVDGAASAAGSAETDENGRFRIAGLVSGEYRVLARRSGFALTVLRGVAAGKDDLRVVVVPGTTVSGTVVDESGNALSRLRIQLVSDDDVYVASGRSDEQGRFEMTDVPPDGKWKVHVRGNVAGTWLDKRLEQTVDSGATDVKVEVK